jgi:hypothetical protein
MGRGWGAGEERIGFAGDGGAVVLGEQLQLLRGRSGSGAGAGVVDCQWAGPPLGTHKGGMSLGSFWEVWRGLGRVCM